MFLFLLFLHFHSCSSFFPVPLFHLLYSLLSLFSLSLGDDTKWPSKVDVSLNPNTINQSNEGFKSIGHSVKVKNYKIYFQDCIPGSHLGVPTGTIKIFFTNKLPLYFLPSFESIGHPFRRRVQNVFSKWEWSWPSQISNQNKLRYSYLHIATILQTKFWVKWPLGLKYSTKKILKMAVLVAILAFWSDHFYLFLIYKLPRYFVPSFASSGIWVQGKKFKIAFQDGSHLGFQIGTTLATFHLSVSSQLVFQFNLSSK